MSQNVVNKPSKSRVQVQPQDLALASKSPPRLIYFPEQEEVEPITAKQILLLLKEPENIGNENTNTNLRGSENLGTLMGSDKSMGSSIKKFTMH